MLKFVALAAGLMLAGTAVAQQSLQYLHARVPAPPASAAAAPEWLASPELAALHRQIRDQRRFVASLSRKAGAAAQSAAPVTAPAQNSGDIDFQRAARDPEYARQVQARIATLSPEEQMKIATQFQQAYGQSALTDAQAIAADPLEVRRAAERYSDYRVKHMSDAGIQDQYIVVNDIRLRVSSRDLEISKTTVAGLKCSDGEGSCPAADKAADQVKLRAAFDRIIAEYDKALPIIAQQVEAARRSRAAEVLAAQRDLEPARYGSAAQSSTNRQLLAAYHSAVLGEVEELLALSEDSAKWAAARFEDRSIDSHKID